VDEQTVGAYLDRIRMPRPDLLDAGSLKALHQVHLQAVPFENLSLHLGERISLDEDALIDKIVTRRRGGFCYELNGAFGLLLRGLGADVSLFGARVHGPDGIGPPFDHLVLMVHLPDGTGPWLTDVGFGRHSRYPLAFVLGREQDDPDGRFLLVENDPQAGEHPTDVHPQDVDVLMNGEPQYRIEMRERSLRDFAPTCWWHSTSPDSHFSRNVICSRLADDGRISLSQRTLITTVGESRTERELPTDEAVLAAYHEHFGLLLERVPTL
jgi:N-hydroxyarylamine O-acetyltransferase